jgi:prepilin-type N-terminal cleavage/methylation domain-containing protein
MKTLSRKSRAFTLIELLVVIVIVGILITIAVPNIETGGKRSKMTETLANARSLQQATQMMALDSAQSGEGLRWTSQVKDGKSTPVSLAQYLDALTQGGYMTESDLRKVLSAPGKTPKQGKPTADNIAFKIYEVSEDSPSDQVFITTANVDPPSGGMKADALPYGNKSFVFFTKGGGGGIRTRASDATSTNTFPIGKNRDGKPYRYVPLK